MILRRSIYRMTSRNAATIAAKYQPSSFTTPLLDLPVEPVATTGAEVGCAVGVAVGAAVVGTPVVGANVVGEVVVGANVRVVVGASVVGEADEGARVTGDGVCTPTNPDAVGAAVVGATVVGANVTGANVCAVVGAAVVGAIVVGANDVGLCEVRMKRKLEHTAHERGQGKSAATVSPERPMHSSASVASSADWPDVRRYLCLYFCSMIC